MNTIRPLLRTAALAAALAATAALAQPAPASRLDTRLSAAPRSVVLVDRIVAVVNDEMITAVELGERTRPVTAQLRRGGGALPPTETLQRQVLERMINDLVQIQMAKGTGIKGEAGFPIPGMPKAMLDLLTWDRVRSTLSSTSADIWVCLSLWQPYWCMDYIGTDQAISALSCRCF